MALLEGQAHTWYQVQGNVSGWDNLKSTLLGYFKPADYTFKTRQALAKSTQKGSVAEYFVGFSEQYTHCADVNEAEDLFHFVDGLFTNIQAWVCTQKPVDLQSAMQMAE